MRLKKILNNNAIIIRDGNEEKIAIGTGIAFQKKKNDIIDSRKIEKLFVLNEHEKFQQLLQKIPTEYFTLTEEIIDYAEQALGTKLNSHIHLALTDHLTFAIDRIRSGISLKNKLLNEIKILYKKEFQISLWALEHIKKKLNIEMPIDEAGFISLHLHAANAENATMKQTIRQTTIINEMVKTFNAYFNMEVSEENISYQRFITHLRFALLRIDNEEPYNLDSEMNQLIINKYPIAYDCAKKMASVLAQKYQISLANDELGYLTLHIERLRNLNQ